MPFFRTVADLLRVIAGRDMAPASAAILVAAGSSSRIGGDMPKPLLPLCGTPILAHTLVAFQRCPLVDEIVVVAREQDADTARTLAHTYGITKLTHVVAGGATRAESVARGVEAVSERTKYVAIHDAARCLITPEQISRVLRTAYIHRAASAACPVTDTVKLRTKRGFIEKTIDRRSVYLAQTPQVFHADLYRAALQQVGRTDLTDDNQLMEALGFPVKLVNCGSENLKITYPEDLERARDILTRRNES